MSVAGPDCLVPGDSDELQVRRQYGDWVAAGLPAVRELATEAPVDIAWPDRRGELAAAAPVRGRAVEPADADRARAERWLVTGSGDPETTEGPLAGLSVAVKDVIDVAGLPTGNGANGLPARHPATHAPVWSALAEGGARCAGKAATHEMAWGVTTPSIGNPFDPERYAGGSSGGSAAAVAAGAADAGLGTDTGGSIRIPAALCGVVGLRPTVGRTDMRGVTPLAPDQDVVGPLARDVATAAAMLDVILARRSSPAARGVAGLRVGHLTRVGRLDQQVDDHYLAALRELQRGGVELVEVDTALPRLSASVSLLTMLTSSASLYAEDVRASPLSYGSATRALLTLGEGVADARSLGHARRALRARTAALFRENALDAVVTPTTPCVAPLKARALVDLGGRQEPVDAALTRFTAWASATGLPAVAVPTGAAPLPTSVQFMAPPDREDTCLQLAQFIESVRTNQR